MEGIERAMRKMRPLEAFFRPGVITRHCAVFWRLQCQAARFPLPAFAKIGVNQFGLRLLLCSLDSFFTTNLFPTAIASVLSPNQKRHILILHYIQQSVCTQPNRNLFFCKGVHCSSLLIRCLLCLAVFFINCNF